MAQLQTKKGINNMEINRLAINSKYDECICSDSEDTEDYGFFEVDCSYDEVSTSLNEAVDDFKDLSRELYEINCLIESGQPIDDIKIMEMRERVEQLDLYSEEIVAYTANWRESIDNYFDNISNKES